MRNLNLLSRNLVLFWSLAAVGCGGALGPGPASTPDPSSATSPDPVVTVGTDPPSVAALVAEIQTDLRSLETMASIDAQGLFVDGPAANACYVHPCNVGRPTQALADEYARQAPRVAALADLASAVAVRRDTLPPAADTAANLAALNALDIVYLADLVTVAPANNANCYSLPCPEDRARADAENAKRAAVVHALAAEAAAAGL